MVEPMDRIQWKGTTPDTSHERYYPLARPTAHQSVYGILISTHMVCVPTHWMDNHTTPCEGGNDHCEGCRGGYAVRWKAYVGGYTPMSGKISIFELTPEAVRNCPRIAGEGKVVRGVHLKLFRRGKYSNAPVVAHVMGESKPHEVPVIEFDVRPHLLRIWRMVPTRGMHKRHVRHDHAHEERGPA